MKKLILLVGPMGSGKSTYCQKYLQDYRRINQDDQGPQGHKVAFQEALDEGVDIVIDRCNFDKDQRGRFLEPAKEVGYSTKIIVMNRKFRTCYKRLKKRTGHPNLNADNDKGIDHALSMYFNKYTYVRDNEADEVVRTTDYDPHILDITKQCKGERVILIGDVHGCYDEVKKLLDKVNWQPYEDVVIFAGDLCDRGPKIKEIYDWIRKSQALGAQMYTIMGNHDNKFLRFLRGNKVNTHTHGFQETINQMGIEDHDLRMWMESLPYAIKFADNSYVVHAGINPSRHMEKQRHDTLMYARTYNPDTGSVTDSDKEPWYSFKPYDNTLKVYFGHSICDKFHVSDWAKSLDGGAYEGKVLRAAIVQDGVLHDVVEVKSDFTYKEGKYDVDWHPSLVPYYERCQKKLLSKCEKGDLVSYKYTDKCVFDRSWDEYTRRSRGIIFNKATGKVVARPFEKFYNVNEMPETTMCNLEVLIKKGIGYETHEKLDGSLGILYRFENELCIATCGSFYSEQAIEATKILRERYSADDFNENFTYLFEIIYPSNKIVVNYGDQRDIVLLAIIETKTGKEVVRGEVEAVAASLDMPFSKIYAWSLKEITELQKILPVNEEGFVVHFDNGLRVKFKGEEYLRVHRALNGATPLNVWRNMTGGILPDDYKVAMPEEVIPGIEDAQIALEKQYKKTLEIIKWEADRIIIKVGFTPTKKDVGLYLKANKLEYGSIMFAFLFDSNNKSNKQKLDDFIMKKIRPRANIL